MAGEYQLKLMQYNLENFFLYLDHYNNQNLSDLSEDEWQKLSGSIEKNKELSKVKAIADIITSESPDVIFVNEVGGAESLENFCKHFLNDSYKAVIVEGNSDRGIDIGFLLKSDLKLKSLHISHKNRPLNFLYDFEKGGSKKSQYFSRDVSELRLFSPDNPNTPLVVCLCVHLKSKLDRDGIDPQGRKRRAAELEMLVQIYNEVCEELEHNVPVVLGGDFNGIAGPINTEPEFEYLYENSNLKDVMELCDVPQADRTTQIMFNFSGKSNPVQIDYFFVDQKFKDLIVREECKVYMYKSDMDVELPYEKSLEQRSRLPSDHHPIMLAIRLG